MFFFLSESENSILYLFFLVGVGLLFLDGVANFLLFRKFFPSLAEMDFS